MFDIIFHRNYNTILFTQKKRSFTEDHFS